MSALRFGLVLAAMAGAAIARDGKPPEPPPGPEAGARFPAFPRTTGISNYRSHRGVCLSCLESGG